MLIQNAIRTPDGTILDSRSRHDYKSYVDTINGQTYMVDGGLDYIRRSIGLVEDLTLHDDDPHEVIREKLLRGTRGKDGKGEFRQVLLKDIDDEWLNNIIEYEEKHRPNNFYLKYYRKELELRKENHY